MQRGRGLGLSYIKQDGKHQHRLVAQRTIGRPLRSGEIVHHLNGDKRDNRPENLEVLSSQSQHARLHNLARFASKGGGSVVGKA
ncbi:MAG: HNH endonuclease [Nitrospira sp.]|nr:MAG: HNH endonuclease [Nitrospira sp.]